MAHGKRGAPKTAAPQVKTHQPGGPKYNATNLAKVVLLARKGYSRNDCFKMIGVHVDTGYNWLRRAKDDPDNCPEILVRFHRALERATAKFNAEMVDQVAAAATSGAPNTWQAAMTMLERRDPENWGRRDKTTVEHSGDPIVQLNQVVLVDPDARSDARALLRRVAGLGTRQPLGIGMGDESEEAGSVEAEPITIEMDPR